MTEKTPEQIALQRIEDAYKRGDTFLDLSHLEIDFLPSEIGSLTKLEKLNISDNKLRFLTPEIGNLINLLRFDLSNNQLDSLPEEIGNLVNLHELNLFYNNLITLPPEIGSLINLIELNLVDNRFTSLPPEIGRLKKLKWFAPCGSSRLEDIPDEIFDLENLEDLSLRDNRLTKISEKIGMLKNLKRLDLSGNNLQHLPDTVGELLNLTEVNLSKNQLENIPTTFWGLHQLVSINLSGNKLDRLSGDVEFLTNLTSINLSNNEISFIPSSLGNLKKLESINLEGNRLQFLPPEIGAVESLIYLNLFANQIEILPDTIGNLVNLYELNLYGNRISFLPKEFGELKKLTWLDLSSNQLAELPLEFSNLKKLSRLYLENNPLVYPSELIDTFSPQKIVNYIQWIKDGKTKSVNEAKILIIGQGGVGKTSLVQMLVWNDFFENQTKTEGITINKWDVANHDFNDKDKPSKIQLNIWDFGGQEIMHATHQFFLTKRSLYLLVLDSRLTQEENRVEYWLKIIQSFGGDSPVLIIGNKTDQHPLDIDRTGLQKKYSNIVRILETSAATGVGIAELKAAITEQVNNLPHVRDLLPETWFTVKTKLEGLGRESNFITHDKYLELCAENEVRDEVSQRTLISFLHDLGVVLHFQDDARLEALGILNPQWVTNGVYKILNSYTLFQNKGVLTVSMLDVILNLPEYPRGKRLFIVDMMKKFELCYDIEFDKTFLVPDLLPKDVPVELKFNGVPAFEYAYPVLPSSVMTRFIVRMNQKIDDGFVWRTGVVLKIGDNTALVKADIEDRKITIAIDGVEHTRRDTLSAIRYQLDEIHGSIKGLDAQKYVPILGATEAEPLEYETLLMMERKGIESIPVRNGRELIDVNVSRMLNGVESEHQRKQYGNVINIYGSVYGGNIIAGDENSVAVGEVEIDGDISGNLALDNYRSSPEEVSFTAYYPKEGSVDTWHTLLVYAHILSVLEKVREDAKRFDDQIKSPKEIISKFSTPIVRGTELTIVPTGEGVKFNPERLSFKWMEDFHRADFRFKGDQTMSGDATSGLITIYAGPLIIGTLKFAMLFNDKEAPSALEHEEHVRMYGKDDIFISYSRKDTEVARVFKTILSATGMDVFLDMDNLRSGQLWNNELLRRIELAGIFQVFWSENYSQSENCRMEWEYALKQNKSEGYIRPVYWKIPLSPKPPEELNKYHFQYVDLKMVIPIAGNENEVNK